MRIHLKNFRCYTDETFDFGESGLALLSGCSGRGKSSILMAIHFALFGIGTKVVRNGKTSCSVELEFDGLKIVRTRRPNRLVVNDVHEDDAAQDIINHKFGETFDVTGYIPQDAVKSFVRMSPMEKLAFLERFAFKDVDLGKIKERSKSLINKRHDEMLEATSKLDVARAMIKQIPTPVKVTFPIKCKESQRERVINNEKVKFKNCGTLIKRSEKVISSSKHELSDVKVLEAILKTKSEAVMSLEDKLSRLDSECDGLTFEGDDYLKSCTEQLEKIVLARDIVVAEEKLKEDEAMLEQMRVDEIAEQRAELDRISSALWKEYTEEELKSTIDDCKNCIEDMKIVKRLRKEIDNYEVSEDDLNDKIDRVNILRGELTEKTRNRDLAKRRCKTYDCPSCEATLRVEDDVLIMVDPEEIDGFSGDDEDIDILTKKIESLSKQIRVAEGHVSDIKFRLGKKEEAQREIESIMTVYEEESDINSLRDDLAYLNDYYSLQNELLKKQLDINRSISEERFSSSYVSFQKSISKQMSEIKSMRKKNPSYDMTSMSEDELRTLIADQQYAKTVLDNISKQRKSLECEISQLKDVILKADDDHVKKYGVKSTVDHIVGIIDREEKTIEDLERKREEHAVNLKVIDDYLRYTEAMENHSQWNDKIKELEESEKLARSQYASATLLRDKILEAESMAMSNVIASINTHAQMYLEHFFPDHPIVVRLSPFKETKKNVKPQINIEIDYKGMECDLTMLSGGEVSRVILAYTLALGEMFNIPLLMLDECTSSLDQDMTTTVFNSIREHFSGRLVVIVAHQVVTGAFDTIIKLGEDD